MSELPSYKYKPSGPLGEPTIRSRSNRRARLFIGGTYFRAKNPGQQGNNISVELLEFVSEVPGEEGMKKGKLVVTNHNTLFNENVVGPVDVLILDQKLKWNERYKIEQLSTQPALRYYSISLQISAGESLQADLGNVSFSELLYVPDKLSVKLAPKSQQITQNSVIVIKPRVRVYDLTQIEVTTTNPDGTPGQTYVGWDPAALRAAVNATDPWIEMMPRSGTPRDTYEPGVPPPQAPDPKYDEQDDGIDDYVLTTFPDTYLLNGDGLPSTPSAERTGPYRSLIHVNYDERPDGTLAETNSIYEWVGDSASSGEWKAYD